MNQGSQNFFASLKGPISAGILLTAHWDCPICDSIRRDSVKVDVASIQTFVSRPKSERSTGLYGAYITVVYKTRELKRHDWGIQCSGILHERLPERYGTRRGDTLKRKTEEAGHRAIQ